MNELVWKLSMSLWDACLILLMGLCEFFLFREVLCNIVLSIFFFYC